MGVGQEKLRLGENQHEGEQELETLQYVQDAHNRFRQILKNEPSLIGVVGAIERFSPPGDQENRGNMAFPLVASCLAESISQFSEEITFAQIIDVFPKILALTENPNYRKFSTFNREDIFELFDMFSSLYLDNADIEAHMADRQFINSQTINELIDHLVENLNDGGLRFLLLEGTDLENFRQEYFVDNQGREKLLHFLKKRFSFFNFLEADRRFNAREIKDLWLSASSLRFLFDLYLSDEVKEKLTPFLEEIIRETASGIENVRDGNYQSNILGNFSDKFENNEKVRIKFFSILFPQLSENKEKADSLMKKSKFYDVMSILFQMVKIQSVIFDLLGDKLYLEKSKVENLSYYIFSKLFKEEKSLRDYLFGEFSRRLNQRLDQENNLLASEFLSSLTEFLNEMAISDFYKEMGFENPIFAFFMHNYAIDVVHRLCLSGSEERSEANPLIEKIKQKPILPYMLLPFSLFIKEKPSAIYSRTTELELKNFESFLETKFGNLDLNSVPDELIQNIINILDLMNQLPICDLTLSEREFSLPPFLLTNFLIIGPPIVGKTTAVEKIIEASGKILEREGRTLNFIKVAAPFLTVRPYVGETLEGRVTRIIVETAKRYGVDYQTAARLINSTGLIIFIDEAGYLFDVESKRNEGKMDESALRVVTSLREWLDTAEGFITITIRDEENREQDEVKIKKSALFFILATSLTNLLPRLQEYIIRSCESRKSGEEEIIRIIREIKDNHSFFYSLPPETICQLLIKSGILPDDLARRLVLINFPPLTAEAIKSRLSIYLDSLYISLEKKGIKIEEEDEKSNEKLIKEICDLILEKELLVKLQAVMTGIYNGILIESSLNGLNNITKREVLDLLRAVLNQYAGGIFE